jgi:hypothetical protein
MKLRIAPAWGKLLLVAIVLISVCCMAFARHDHRKLPSTLNLRQTNGTVDVWNVELVDKPMCMANDTGVKWGITNCDKRTIRLWAELSDEQLADMFVHEAMHAVTNCSNADEELHDAIYEMAPQLRRIFRDNPRWAEFVMRAPVTEPLPQYGVGPVDESCAPALRTARGTRAD